MNFKDKDMTLLQLGLCDLVDLVAAGDVSVAEVTAASLRAAEEIGRVANAYIAIESEQALERAADLDKKLAAGAQLGRLYGVPLAHKDMFYRKGFEVSGGSSIRRAFRPSTTATVIDRLESAGSVTIGRLNMAEFALNPTGHNRHNGNCLNPWDLSYCPGGSSSGSGAAVASRTVFGSLGSDTGGSIRVPSAMCALTGLKGTQGRVSRHGVMPLSFSYDCVGPLARSARDCARLMSVIAGVDSNDPTCSIESVDDYEGGLTGDIRGIRIGFAVNAFNEAVDPEVLAAFEVALDSFRARGAIVVPIEVPRLGAITTYTAIVQRAEMATIHAQWMRDCPDDYATHVSSRLYAGYAIPAVAYIEALSQRGALVRAFCSGALDGISALLTPTLRMTVPTLDETDMDNGTPETEAKFSAVTDHARLVNYLGLPAMSVPCGLDSRGLPIGLQLIGRPYAEGTLLKLADAYQRETYWHSMLPPLLAGSLDYP